MDIVGILFTGLMILIGIVIFSILPVLTYLLYRVLKKKGKLYKNIGLIIFSLTTLGILVLAQKTIFGPSGFGPEYESVTIKQKIGGNLICKSVYNADIQNWQIEVSYKYVNDNGDSIIFGEGTYYNREWGKDDQIIKIDDWLILKTGYEYGSDKVIVKNIQTDSTYIYGFYDQFIESDSLWKSQNISSLLNYCCAESFIEKISGNEIFVKYKFRTNESLTKKYNNRTIVYRFDPTTGLIKMIRIKE
jgi:hypothetical protein